MNARILLLIVGAAGLAVYVAMRAPANPNDQLDEVLTEDQIARRECDSLLWLRELPGEEPDVEVDIDVSVSVVGGLGKNQLAFDFTESHGYYVETFEVDFWYKQNPDTDYNNSKLKLHAYFDDFLKANETRRLCLEVVKPELEKVGGEMGTNDNWGVVLDRYSRARKTNPGVLPCQNKDDNCQ